MSDNIKRIREELPFTCTPVGQVVSERKQDGHHEFDKKKKGKKDMKAQERQTVSANRETTSDAHEGAQDEHKKILAKENQCGNIVDIEA